jgi:hypothetical protein
MSNPDSTRPVTVTAEEHAYPALQKLARACIALARHRRQLAVAPNAAGEGPRHD